MIFFLTLLTNFLTDLGMGVALGSGFDFPFASSSAFEIYFDFPWWWISLLLQG